MESLNKIDLSGLKDRKIQYFCLFIFFILLSLLILIHQYPLLKMMTVHLDTSHTAHVIKIEKREGLSYPIYQYKNWTHTSLIDNQKAKVNESVKIRCAQKHPDIFYSEYEIRLAATVFYRRIIIVGVFILLALFCLFRFHKIK